MNLNENNLPNKYKRYINFNSTILLIRQLDISSLFINHFINFENVNLSLDIGITLSQILPFYIDSRYR